MTKPLPTKSGDTLANERVNNPAERNYYRFGRTFGSFLRNPRATFVAIASTWPMSLARFCGRYMLCAGILALTYYLLPDFNVDLYAWEHKLSGGGKLLLMIALFFGFVILAAALGAAIMLAVYIAARLIDLTFFPLNKSAIGLLARVSKFLSL